MTNSKITLIAMIARTKPLKVFVCLCTLITFSWSFIIVDAGGADAIGQVQGDSPRQLHPDTFVLPEALGRVTGSWTGNPQKIVINIQDAHCNYAAQAAITDIIAYVSKNYGVRTINLEGGVKEYNLTPFTSISDSQQRRKISDYFVRKGLVSGAEQFAINNPQAITLWGVEDKELYLRNLAVYRESLAYKEQAESYLALLSSALSKLKLKIYSDELLEFDLKFNQYKAGNLDFKDYLIFLSDTARARRIDARPYSNIALLRASLADEKGIDFKRADVEREMIIDELRRSLSRDEVEDLARTSARFRIGDMKQKDFYSYLLDKASRISLDMTAFSNLRKYAEYISTYEAVDTMKLFEELSALETKLRASLCVTDDQTRLCALSKNLALTKNLFAISMSKDDYLYYRKHRDDFAIRAYTSFITDKAPVYGLSDIAIDDSVNLVDGYRDDMEAFFVYSMDRDDAFIKNIRFDLIGRGAESSAQRSEASILVTGGFHTENLARLFRENNISYITIMPGFRSADDQPSPYFSLLAGKADPVAANIKTILGYNLAIASMLNELGYEVTKTDTGLLMTVYAQWKAASDQGKGITIVGDAGARGVDKDGNLTTVTDANRDEFVLAVLPAEQAIVTEQATTPGPVQTSPASLVGLDRQSVLVKAPIIEEALRTAAYVAGSWVFQLFNAAFIILHYPANRAAYIARHMPEYARATPKIIDELRIFVATTFLPSLMTIISIAVTQVFPADGGLNLAFFYATNAVIHHMVNRFALDSDLMPASAMDWIREAFTDKREKVKRELNVIIRNIGENYRPEINKDFYSKLERLSFIDEIFLQEGKAQEEKKASAQAAIKRVGDDMLRAFRSGRVGVAKIIKKVVVGKEIRLIDTFRVVGDVSDWKDIGLPYDLKEEDHVYVFNAYQSWLALEAVFGRADESMTEALKTFVEEFGAPYNIKLSGEKYVDQIYYVMALLRRVPEGLLKSGAVRTINLNGDSASGSAEHMKYDAATGEVSILLKRYNVQTVDQSGVPGLKTVGVPIDKYAFTASLFQALGQAMWQGLPESERINFTRLFARFAKGLKGGDVQLIHLSSLGQGERARMAYQMKSAANFFAENFLHHIIYGDQMQKRLAVVDTDLAKELSGFYVRISEDYNNIILRDAKLIERLYQIERFDGAGGLYEFLRARYQDDAERMIRIIELMRSGFGPGFFGDNFTGFNRMIMNAVVNCLKAEAGDVARFKSAMKNAEGDVVIMAELPPGESMTIPFTGNNSITLYTSAERCDLWLEGESGSIVGDYRGIEKGRTSTSKGLALVDLAEKMSGATLKVIGATSADSRDAGVEGRAPAIAGGFPRLVVSARSGQGAAKGPTTVSITLKRSELIDAGLESLYNDLEVFVEKDIYEMLNEFKKREGYALSGDLQARAIDLMRRRTVESVEEQNVVMREIYVNDDGDIGVAWNVGGANDIGVYKRPLGSERVTIGVADRGLVEIWVGEDGRIHEKPLNMPDMEFELGLNSFIDVGSAADSLKGDRKYYKFNALEPAHFSFMVTKAIESDGFILTVIDNATTAGTVVRTVFAGADVEDTKTLTPVTTSPAASIMSDKVREAAQARVEPTAAVPTPKPVDLTKEFERRLDASPHVPSKAVREISSQANTKPHVKVLIDYNLSVEKAADDVARGVRPSQQAEKKIIFLPLSTKFCPVNPDLVGAEIAKTIKPIRDKLNKVYGINGFIVKTYDGTLRGLEDELGKAGAFSKDTVVAYVDVEQAQSNTPAYAKLSGQITLVKEGVAGNEAAYVSLRGHIILGLALLDIARNDRDDREYLTKVINLMRSLSDNDSALSNVTPDTIRNLLEKGDLQLILPPLAKIDPELISSYGHMIEAVTSSL